MYWIAEHCCGYYLGERGKEGGIWMLEPKKTAKHFASKREIQAALDNLPDYYKQGFEIKEVDDNETQAIPKVD